MNEIDRIQESSQYLATLLRCRAELAEWLGAGKNLYRRFPLTELYQDLQLATHEAESFDRLLLAFREFKQRHFLRIGGRDLLGLADLSETTAQLSDLACVSLQVGLDLLSGHPEWWVGEGEQAAWREVREKNHLVVMGMGKLGGQELNYVSDVDLLFLYAPGDEKSSVHPDTFFLLSRLCQWIARLLSEGFQGDRVFQVDLRLRPQGKDGPLVPSVAGASDYYLNRGSAWERQVLLKTRPVAGDRSLGTAFLREVRPFVFRRFLDFQALDELRDMRDRILTEAVRPQSGWRQFDVKLGIGGIREIEFLVQSLQLIYGGRHPELDEPNTLRCLERLHDLRLLPSGTVDELKDCYVFLRRVEHWVQLDQNRQTQKLPQSEEARKRLSLALGFGEEYGGFLEKLESCCAAVHHYFLDLFHSNGRKGAACPEGQGLMTAICKIAVASGEEPDEAAATSINFPPEALSRLSTHLDSFSPYLQETVGAVLRQYAHLRDPELSEKVILRLERYFSQVRKRPGLVKLFQTTGSWVGDFCRGLIQSELLSDLLTHNPSLAEGIATVSGELSDAASWQASCRRLLDHALDYEGGLEWLRRLKNERLLQLVLADLRGDLDPEALEIQLSALADFVIRDTYERIRKSLQMDEDLGLCVLALGKLGSREMSYLSDLDLVFVYQPKPGESEEHIPSDVVRLIQRFMRMLSTPLQEGPGYEVDTRLRPTGNYGTLIVTRGTWLEYYSKQADLWEIQAMLRVRGIAGDRELGDWIEKTAREICYQKRPAAQVRQRLCHLRQRMQHERAEEKADAIDIKLGMGGLTDLEFLVQGHLLIEGYKKKFLQNPSVRASLENVLKDVPELEPSAQEILTAFHALRSFEHRLRLHTNQTSSRLTPAQFEAMQAMGLWPPVCGKSHIESWQDLLRLRRRVRAAMKSFCPEL